jgi:vancomycin aglycone glucosyltransferase
VAECGCTELGVPLVPLGPPVPGSHAGTTTTAVRAGVPQLVVPLMMDQSYWARRVAGLGMGAAHEGAVPDLPSLSAALEMALAPAVRVRAGEVARMVRTDGAMVGGRPTTAAIRGKG